MRNFIFFSSLLREGRFRLARRGIADENLGASSQAGAEEGTE
jgi:hypothetical protein